VDSGGDGAQAVRWWSDPRLWIAMALLSALPLLWPETPPLVDVPGHIAHYRVQLDLDSSPDLQRYWDFRWALIGNLGVDLLVIPLAGLIGLEPAVKVIVIAIPPLTVLGIYWTAREIHGTAPPTALFAVPFAYAYPFTYGFLNFSLSMALSLLAFGLWLRLGRTGRTGLRVLLFVPLSCVLWLVHAFGWGVLGLLAWSAEVVRHRNSGCSWPESAAKAASAVVPLGPPLLLMIAWRSGAGGETNGFLDPGSKLYAILATLRDRWQIWDVIGIVIALLLIWAAAFDRKLEFARRLAIPAIILLAVFVALPYKLMGSAYADLRLAPFIFIVAIAAIRFTPVAADDARRRMAWLGLLFIIARLGGTTLSYAIADREMRERLGALDVIPRGAAVLSLTGEHCGTKWEIPRHAHVGSFVIIRRSGFSNDQWQTAGAQLLRSRHAAAGDFQADPSGTAFSKACQEQEWRQRGSGPALLVRAAEDAISEFPRDAFQFVWVVDAPDFPMTPRPGLRPIWRGRDSILYRVEPTAVKSSRPS
jgi:hypothetical protein